MAVREEQWFSDNVRPHEAQLRSYLRSAFPSVGDVDDLVQESYFRIWKARAARPIHSARGFLFKVARHLALDLVRRNHRAPIETVGDLDGLYVIEEKPDAAERSSIQEKIDLLAEAVAGLPARRREIVILCKLRLMSHKEAAARLGISERTVENQLFRGIRQCRAYLEKRGVTTLFG
jgi:RNA polymerase sigma-70 factor (ECF subfamily)